ncbi:MAG: UDP-N-acetylmuramoyl-L-alanyl-D-glutamate--2,6-diaminopimelate ligase [Oscillospiraceae bacterium]|jgi:UDP-N-acetylmuramoyl-L-alanyl-D-glutamate--2,6-diaminopimelate ligase|nr:UDP-N-acetylmuramoyl-L-alanyl-D-glutamate--2,6-diaminopimelate ligase [Oscillospiraceae bacterium]
MKLKDLFDGLKIGGSTADMDSEASGVSYDSRRVKSGDVFVAVRGFNCDGHDHIADAAANGAVCVVTQDAAADGLPYVSVENTRAALAVLSANLFGRPAEKLKIIGVTGTNGKTTVTYLIKEIIERATGAKTGLIGTIRNMVGAEELWAEFTTPESYELHELFANMVGAGCEYAVMEVSSHALALDRVYGIEFDVGVFTNLTSDHLDFHKSMEEYGDAKLKLFAQCRKAAVNLDDDFSRAVIDLLRENHAPLISFSTLHDEADLVAKRIKLYSDRMEFCALTIGVLQKVELGIPGMFSVYNALAATSAAMLLGIDIQSAAAALGECPGVPGRAEVVPTGGDFTVLIDYAHTPDALEKIIASARQGARGRVVTLFGCGGDRDKTKRPVMGEIAVRLSDFVIVTTDNPRTEAPDAIIGDILAGIDTANAPHIVIEDRREAIKWAIANSQTNDVLILAGKGHETYQILGTERVRFDEREVVAQALAAAAEGI